MGNIFTQTGKGQSY